MNIKTVKYGIAAIVLLHAASAVAERIPIVVSRLVSDEALPFDF
jgi:hypothetical protein